MNGLRDAYFRYLEEILHSPRFRNAPRGFASSEVIGASFVVGDPRRRVVPLRTRRSNIVFNFAEALWYYAGLDDFDYLAYYAPQVSRFVSGATCLTGTAYGPRIFRFGPDEVDQWSAVVRTLREDPDSKRAVIQIFRPEELLVESNPDVACTIALQYLVRENRLHTIGFMRANDAYRGIVSDVFSFTFLQELMARQLGLELGSYTHMVGSLHVYEPDRKAAAETLRAARVAKEVDDRMPSMPAGDQRPHVEQLMVLERELRLNTLSLEEADLDGVGLPGYWLQVLTLLELHRRVRHGDNTPANGLLSRLHPLYRHMFLSRFPGLAGSRPAVGVLS